MKDQRALRKHARRKIEVLVFMEVAGKQVEHLTRELSEGGVFIVTDKPLKVGTKAEFGIKIGTELLKVQGEVVYLVDKEKGDTEVRDSGMGIRFVNLDPEAKKKIISIIF